MNTKIQTQHQEKIAYIYVRQSTMAQVRFHRESTERQYALKDKALQLGWAPDQIQILDKDLGLSGAQSSNRQDFKALVAEVSMGNAGAIFSLEASRLARSSLDWQRLIELCALTQTLVIDEDGCYNPADFNDGLLLGIKGTIAQAELHIIRARLLGGKLNKAQKGELRFPLPVGLCYDEDATIVDPDQEVQASVRFVFSLFRETGSAYGVVHRFAEKGIRFPKRSYGGAWDGKLVWGRLSQSRILSILKNPSYAGAYVYGRYQSSKQILANGEIQTRSTPTPIESWKVLIKDHHEGYISWEDFQENQLLLAKNQSNAKEAQLPGPAREGLALLQGLLLCHNCGRKLTPRYTGNRGIYPLYECNWLKREGLSKTNCMSLPCGILDQVISERVLKVIEPHQLQLALDALKVLERRDNDLSRHWLLRLDRAEYEAQLAERRYEEVDPSNRIVAVTLERRWNEALVRLKEANKDLEIFRKENACIATEEQKAQVLALAKDFPRLWKAPTTRAKDRKRMLRLLIKDITVERKPGVKTAILHVWWQGGECEDLTLELPPHAAAKARYPEKVVCRVRELARTRDDQQIATVFNTEGLAPSKGKAFTVPMIQWIRYKHRIPAPTFARSEELTVHQVASKFGVSYGVVYYWIKRGVLPARRRSNLSPYWITIDNDKEHELAEWTRDSNRIHPKKSTGSPNPIEGGAL